MALTLTVTTPLTDDDRRILTAVLGIDPGPSSITLASAGISPLALAAAQTAAASPAPTPAPASETEADAGAPGDGMGLDANGLPWDDLIHSSNRKKNADGSWQKRRGVQDAVFDARVAEIRATQAIVARGEEPTAAEVFNQQVSDAAATLVPTPPAPPAPPAPAGDWDGQPGFLRVMKLITAKKLPAERLNALLIDVGLAPTTTALLKADGATRETFAALLDGEGA